MLKEKNMFCKMNFNIISKIPEQAASCEGEGFINVEVGNVKENVGIMLRM